MSTASQSPPRVERRSRPRVSVLASRRFFDQLVVSGKKHRGRIRAVLIPIVVALHVAVFGALVVVPLLTSHDLPDLTTAGGVHAFFVEPEAAPPPPPPPPAPPKAAVVAAPKPAKMEAPRPTEVPKFVAPVQTPPELPKEVIGAEGVSAPEMAADTGVAGGVQGGVAGGVPGGVQGGVVGGVEGGTLGGQVGGVVGGAPKEEPPAPSGPVRVGGKIKEPKKLRNAAPEYPDIAKQARVQGVVVLEATIDESGRVDNVRVLRGVPLLNESALAAVRKWVYSPTLLNGTPVSVIMTVTVNFTLS